MEQNKFKNYLYWAGVFALLLGSYSAWAYVNYYGQSIQPGNYRSFAVTGEGKVTAKNDIAQFTYSVNIEGGKDITAIKKESDTKTGQIQTFLKAQGIDDKDVTTVNYSLQPRYQYTPCPVSAPGIGAPIRPCQPQEIVGYTLSQTDSVKIRDLSKTDKVVSGVVTAGANEVSQLTFTVDDPSSLQTQAKGLAIKQAIERAQSMASTAGFKVGRIISIDEAGNSPVPMYSMGVGGVAKSLVAPVSDANLNPGSNDITSDVSVRFEIQ